jgi:hypothetical protein
MKNYEIASAVIIFFLAWLIPVAVCIWVAKTKDRKWYWFALLAIASWVGVALAHNIPPKKKALSEAEEKLRKQIEEAIKSEAKSEVLASIEASRVGFAKDEEWLIVLMPNSVAFSSLKTNKNFTITKEKSREKIQIYETFLSPYNIIVQSPDNAICKFKILKKDIHKLRSWFPKLRSWLPKAEVIRSFWSSWMNRHELLTLGLFFFGLIVLCVSVVKVYEITTDYAKRPKENRVAAYESELERICISAIRTWQANPNKTRIQYRPSSKPWIFLSDEHHLARREELMPPNNASAVIRKVQAVAYVFPRYYGTGQFYGQNKVLYNQSSGVKAVKIDWDVYLVDVTNATVTAHKLFSGPEPPQTVSTRLFNDSHFRRGYGVEPMQAYLSWLESLPYE